ncbi:hypothetical protein niasHT_021833 [Heterodera trifolii]|uniref:B30.2/SPRY domain-containing protein n=1 Tax=Heterodera trifolii TaxID=157864 RepID=A0ABD2JEL1_9BILA
MLFLLLLFSSAPFALLFLPLDIFFTQIVPAKGGNGGGKGCYGYCEKFNALEDDLEKMRQIKANAECFVDDMGKVIKGFEKKLNKLRTSNETNYEEEMHIEHLSHSFNVGMAMEEGQYSGEGNYEDEEEAEEEPEIEELWRNSMKRKSLEPIEEGEEGEKNQWDQSEGGHHKELKISGKKKWIITNEGSGRIGRTAFAEFGVPKKAFGIFYFEVKIINNEGPIYIGLAEKGKKGMPVTTLVGHLKGTYAYGSGGVFYGHTGENISNYMEHQFGENDIVGCGMNLKTREIFYTKNGNKLNLFVGNDNVKLFVDQSKSNINNLYPCVSLVCPGDKITANFGDKFKFKIKDNNLE